MTTPFASAGDAASYGFALPDASASGLLARATQMLIDAAGFGIVSSSATVRVRADHARLTLTDVPLVTDVTGVELVHDDGTTDTVTDWRVVTGPIGSMVAAVHLRHSVPERHCGLFAVTLTQGLPSVPDSLVMLTSAVAYRLAAMPAAMAAGITSRSVGGVSWSASTPPPSGDLTAVELRKLGKIVPVRTVWPVKM